jgi:hypothetical protein
MKGQYRQGDVILVPVDDIPSGGYTVNRREEFGKGEGLILAAGEATGHHHRVKESGARMVMRGMEMYLRVPKSGATITHEEHDPIKLPAGSYKVGGQREYISPTPTRPASQRRVFD